MQGAGKRNGLPWMQESQSNIIGSEWHTALVLPSFLEEVTLTLLRTQKNLFLANICLNKIIQTVILKPCNGDLKLYYKKMCFFKLCLFSQFSKNLTSFQHSFTLVFLRKLKVREIQAKILYYYYYYSYEIMPKLIAILCVYLLSI